MNNNWLPNFQSQLQQNLANMRSNMDNQQANFQAQLQEGLAQMRQGLDEMTAQLRAQADQPGGQNIYGYNNSINQSNNETVINSSNNSTSWTIRSNGLGISSSSNDNGISLKVQVGSPDSFETETISDKELLLEVKYPNDVKRWLRIKITRGTLNVNDFEISSPRRDTILIHFGPPPQPGTTSRGPGSNLVAILQ